MNNPLKEFRPESLCLLKETQEDYWCYARKGPQDFSVYTEKSSIYEAPMKEKFRESSDVLVRWTDGLLYLATIIQVEDEYSRCAVKFEDGSQFWALYKDIYKGPLPDNEFACTVCDSASSQPPDEIVICDKCSVGYHQLCHIPKISTADLNPEIPWSCRKCVFVHAAKKGGASKKGPNAQALAIMKQTLPYEPQALTWDTSHRSNLQQTYCYCGGPGEWYSKMLQCLRCKQWFHEACLQCLDEPLLFGDRYYIFICSLCNKGPEFLRRLPLRWPDIAHLVLFNLTVIHGKKFFEFDTKIMAFLKDNWSQFQIKGEVMSRMPVEEKKKKLLEALTNCKSRFTSGKEIKRKATVWGLRSRIPPPTPVVTLPESGTITNEVLDSINGSRKSKLTPVHQSKISPMHPSKLTPVQQPKLTSVHQSKLASAHQTKSNGSLPPAKRARKLSLDDDVIIIEPDREVIKEEKPTPPPLNVLQKRDHPFRRKSENQISSNQEEEKKNHVRKKVEKASLVEEKPHPTRRKNEKPLPQSRSEDKSKKPTLLPKKKERRKLPHRLVRCLNKPNGLRKVPRTSPILIDLSESDDTSSSHGTLNTIIPHPTDFEGVNNPFLQNYSSNSALPSTTSSVSSVTGSKSRSRLRNRNNCVKVCPSRKFTSTRSSASVINRLLNDSPSNSKVQLPADTSTTTSDLSSSVSSYFGMADRISNGEKFTVLAKRTGPDGKTQYLLQWDSLSSS
nr:metal-response element-binding transcription factor 2 isoform X2 [Parasteatoda tepidariorum]